MIAPEQWINYKDNIYISDLGNVKTINKKGVHRLRKIYAKKCRPTVFMVKIKGKEYRLGRLVWKAFKGEIPEGYYVVHKNGMKSDNSIYNLKLVTKKQLGQYKKKTNRVIDLDTGKIYKSLTECCKALFCTRGAVKNACYGWVKNPIVNCAWWDAENEEAYRGKYRKCVEL